MLLHFSSLIDMSSKFIFKIELNLFQINLQHEISNYGSFYTFEYLDEYYISRRHNREDRSVVYCFKYIITVTLLKYLTHTHTNAYIINSISSENSLTTQNSHNTETHNNIQILFLSPFIFIQHCIGHSSCYIVTYTSFKVHLIQH